MSDALTNDLEVLEAWRQGDRSAGDQLMRRHYTSVLRFFELKATAAADDLTQRTFLACVEGRERFRGEGSFKSYLFGIARMLLLEFLRKRTRDARLVRFGEEDGGPAVTRLSTVVSRHQEQQLLLRALVALPTDMHVALQLYYWEGMPTADIGHALEIPKSTVTTRLARAREQLRRSLETLAKPGPVRDRLMSDLEGWTRSIAATAPSPSPASG
ncbi:MAG: sigma-70 family RNA polymerase sigma factor [Deltaproteobacteria bacterium]|nr:sigma-70 family RNA polymerase sigma factor [Deltaproteobacteria bacterium]